MLLGCDKLLHPSQLCILLLQTSQLCVICYVQRSSVVHCTVLSFCSVIQALCWFVPGLRQHLPQTHGHPCSKGNCCVYVWLVCTSSETLWHVLSDRDEKQGSWIWRRERIPDWGFVNSNYRPLEANHLSLNIIFLGGSEILFKKNPTGSFLKQEKYLGR